MLYSHCIIPTLCYLCFLYFMLCIIHALCYSCFMLFIRSCIHGLKTCSSYMACVVLAMLYFWCSSCYVCWFDMTLFIQEYIHRVGRTARGEGGKGHALLIMRPEELGFLRYLKQSRVPLNEFEFSWSKISNIQAQVCIKQKQNVFYKYFFLL